MHATIVNSKTHTYFYTYVNDMKLIITTYNTQIDMIKILETCKRSQTHINSNNNGGKLVEGTVLPHSQEGGLLGLLPQNLRL